MKENSSTCPKCKNQNVYFDGSLWNCSDCFHEWVENAPSSVSSEGSDVVRDANGNILEEGDSVTIIKDLKVKGSSSTVKIGTKIKNIRLSTVEDGHNIQCKVPGIGNMNLKSEFVKKS